MEEPVGCVTYAALCEVHRELGAHLVVSGGHGPVSIFILPAERVAASRRFFRP